MELGVGIPVFVVKDFRHYYCAPGYWVFDGLHTIRITGKSTYKRPG